MMTGYIKSSSLAQSTVYCLTENLDICIKSSWKDDCWDADRLAMLDLCKSDRGIVCGGDLYAEDRADLDWENRHTKYMYIALQIGRVMIKMDNTVWITDTEQHFTLAYLPGLTCKFKTQMWRYMMDIKSRWIELNRDTIERPFVLASLRRCKLKDRDYEDVWDVVTLALLTPSTVDNYLRDDRIETLSQTTRIGSDGKKEPEPSNAAIPRFPLLMLYAGLSHPSVFDFRCSNIKPTSNDSLSNICQTSIDNPTSIHGNSKPNSHGHGGPSG